MKLALITTLLALCSPTLAALACASGAHPRAADAAYVPPDVVKSAAALASAAAQVLDDSADYVVFDSDTRDATAHAAEIITPGVAGNNTVVVEGMTHFGEDQYGERMTDDMREPFEKLAAVANMYRAHDPLAIFDTAYEQLKQHEVYKRRYGFVLSNEMYDYFTRNPNKLIFLTFLQKLLLHQWHLDYYPHKHALPDHKEIFSKLEKSQYQSYMAMKPEVRAGVHEIYRKNIAALQQRPELVPDLWRIVLSYGGAPAWGCTLDEAYTLYQALNPQAPDHKLDLQGYGVNSVSSKSLRVRNFYSINLAFNFIRDLPQNAIPCTRDAIHLNNNQLQTIAPGAFANQPHLAFLNLSDNAIHRLVPGAFKGLKYLRFLDLAYNPLQNVPRGILHDLYCLKELRTELHGPLALTMDDGVHLPFLHDLDNHDGHHRYIDLYPARAALSGVPVPQFLQSDHFWKLHDEALHLLENVDATRAVYSAIANESATPEYDNLAYEDYQNALAARDAKLPRLIARIKRITRHDGEESSPYDNLEEPLLPDEDHPGCCCCTVS